MLYLSGRLDGQSESFVDYFNATRINNHVYLNWQLKVGNTCNGITILRSTDSLTFSRIGLIPGICGSPTEAARYYHIDPEPVLNRRNYYQLEFGGAGVSEIMGIDLIDFSEKDYQVWPNPSSGITKIYFSNPEQRAYLLHLYNAQGVSLGSLSSAFEYFTLDATDLPHGMYVFTIGESGQTPVLTGKLLVQQ